MESGKIIKSGKLQQPNHPILWRGVLYLTLLTAITAYWMVLVAAAALSGDAITASALGVGALFILWYTGSFYVSVPLSIYFHSKYHSERNYAEIERIHRLALKVLMKLPVRRSWSVAVTMSNLGLLRLCQGNYESAASLFSEAVEYIKSNRRLAASMSAMVINNNLAVALARMQKYYEAEAVAEKALEVARSARWYKKYIMATCAPTAALAFIKLRRGELESAIEQYTSALTLSEMKPIPPGLSATTFDQARLFILFGLSVATIKLGRKMDSLQWCERAWSIIRSRPNLASTLALEGLNILANEYMNNKMYASAEPLLKLAYSVGQQHPFHPDAIQVLNYYEKLLLLTGRQAEVGDMRGWVQQVDMKALTAAAD